MGLFSRKDSDAQAKADKRASDEQAQEDARRRAAGRARQKAERDRMERQRTHGDGGWH